MVTCNSSNFGQSNFGRVDFEYFGRMEFEYFGRMRNGACSYCKPKLWVCSHLCGLVHSVGSWGRKAHVIVSFSH